MWQAGQILHCEMIFIIILFYSLVGIQNVTQMHIKPFLCSCYIPAAELGDYEPAKYDDDDNLNRMRFLPKVSLIFFIFLVRF